MIGWNVLAPSDLELELMAEDDVVWGRIRRGASVVIRPNDRRHTP
jgi:hypothetical protein